MEEGLNQNELLVAEVVELKLVLDKKQEKLNLLLEKPNTQHTLQHLTLQPTCKLVGKLKVEDIKCVVQQKELNALEVKNNSINLI